MPEFSTYLLFQIPNHVAIKIALELKKLLIDNSLLDVYALIFLCHILVSFCTCFSIVNAYFLVLCCSSQSDLEANLFKVFFSVIDLLQLSCF